MMEKIIVSGFGGQGVMLIGQILAYAGMKEEKEVSWLPSYGPEMRGGTANATVIVSNESISSPIVTHPDMAILLNQPSLDRFEPDLNPSGLVLVNTAMVNRPLHRTDVHVIEVDATTIAHEIGNLKVANSVALGAFNQQTRLLSMDSIEQGLGDLFSGKNPKMVEINIRALRAGAEHSRLLQADEVPVGLSGKAVQ